MDYQEFITTVSAFYRESGRSLPWRQPEADGSFDAYKILVSEIMLQQTQVSRVIEKYHQFLQVFPDIDSLAEASLASVLVLWSGLGYNRRAKFLWQTAQQLAGNPQPWSYTDLLACPGIGLNTAAAIEVYAYNQPRIFIETNIRTVYIHHFFRDDAAVPDTAILSLLEKTYDQESPREFYWGLMDYGNYLKATVGNASRQSKHYSKQSKFEGSKRQLRGRVLRCLATENARPGELIDFLADSRAETVIDDLATEGLIENHNGYYRLYTT